jgi:circadian clock protein KaiB
VKSHLRKSTPRGRSQSRDKREVNYVLRLFITGTTPRSTRSVVNVSDFCKRHLGGRYELEVVDIYQQPAAARDEQIIAAPTLIKTLPLPLRRLVGDFSDQERVAAGLGILALSE